MCYNPKDNMVLDDEGESKLILIFQGDYCRDWKHNHINSLKVRSGVFLVK